MAQERSSHTGKILIVEDEENVATVISMYIESEFDNEIIFAKSGNEAIEVLKSNPDITLILSDYNMPNGNGRSLFKFLGESDICATFILVCAEDNLDIEEIPEFLELFENEEELPFITKPFTKEELLDSIKKFIKSKIELLSEGYSPISTDRFLIFKVIPVQAFMKMPGLSKFLPVFNKGDTSPQDIVVKYMKKGIKYLYIKKEEYREFVEQSNKHIQKKLEREDSDKEEDKIKLEEKIFLQFHSIEGVHLGLRDLGLKEKTMELADRFIKTTFNNLKNSPKVSAILGKLLVKKNYLYQLGVITSYLSVAVLEKTEWSHLENCEKLVTASICQDMALRNENYAKIVSVNDSSYQNMSFEEKKEILNHPQKSSELIEELNGFSPDIVDIIKNHHERPDGNGFPRNLDSTNIKPLCCIFIIAHYFSHRLLTEPLNAETLGSINKELKEGFSKGNFERPYEAFVQSFKG